jgi:hypothetical protein
MPEAAHDLADLITNTFCALLGIKTARPQFCQQFATSKAQKHKCENISIVLLKRLQAEKNGGIKHSLATISAKLEEYVEVEKQSSLDLVEDHPEFSVIRQLHLWTFLKHEPETNKQAKLSPVGPVTKEGVQYEESYLIQRLRTQKCTECGKVCKNLGRLNSHLQKHTTEKLYQCKECPKPFRTPWELDQHMMVHTDERSHECQTLKCDSKLETAKELAAHATPKCDSSFRGQRSVDQSRGGAPSSVDSPWARFGVKYYQKA